MQKSANYFACGAYAYRSEIDLFRYERATADRCAVLKAPPGLSWLYVVEGQRGAMSVFGDMHKAWNAMLQSNGRGINSIAVI